MKVFIVWHQMKFSLQRYHQHQQQHRLKDQQQVLQSLTSISSQLLKVMEAQFYLIIFRLMMAWAVNLLILLVEIHIVLHLTLSNQLMWSQEDFTEFDIELLMKLDGQHILRSATFLLLKNLSNLNHLSFQLKEWIQSSDGLYQTILELRSRKLKLNWWVQQI